MLRKCFQSACIACLISLQLSANAQVQEKKPDKNQNKIYRVENELTDTVTENGPQSHWNISARMAHYHIQGLSLAVIKNYKIAWAKGYGWADTRAKTPVTTKTRFLAGSISKSLNSVGVLKLVQDGRIDLFTDINVYLKSWKFPYDSVSKGKKITVANLLSHTAGLSVHGFYGYEITSPLPTIPEILDGKKPANSAPVRSIYPSGLKFEYAGGGTMISELIVSDVTGMPYDEFMNKYVFQPLGMSNSSYTQPPARINAKKLAAGYNKNGQIIPGKYHIYPEQAAGGLWTNPTDLCKYIIETQRAFSGKSEKVLNEKYTKLRLTPYIDKESALGVFIQNLDGTLYFEHEGDDVGFTALYFGSLEKGNGFVIMINSDNYAIIPEIVNSIGIVYGFKGIKNIDP